MCIRDRLVADTKVACCLMHNRDEASYKHFMKEMIEDIKESVKTVSYTHLDVYKRQSAGRVRSTMTVTSVESLC